MDRGLQGLHPAVHDLGKPVWSLTSTTFSPASRKALAEPPVDRISTPVRGQRLAQLDEALLVGNGDQRPLDAGQIGGGRGDVVGAVGHGRSSQTPGPVPG